MLHHFDGGAGCLQGRSAWNLNAVRNYRLDAARMAKVGTHEDNTRIDRCRSKLDTHIQTAPVAKPFDRHWMGNRILITQ